MTFEEILAQVQELLEREGRVAYRILKRRFDLNDEDLEDLKADLIDAKRVAVDEEGKVLVWVGASLVSGSKFQVSGSQPPAPSIQHPDARRQTLDSAAERRQLTVMFCDLVGSTALSTQLDPEELRAVILVYRETCAAAISRFDGYLAKYIGDGLLVYFGYPLAHEDDAQRAVRAGLEIVEALQKQVPSPLVGEGQGEGVNITASAVPTPYPNLPPQGGKEKTRLTRSLQVRIGIHTGLVVAGEMGVGDQPEPLAIVGETPNIAARLQEHAQPNSVVISAPTSRLVTGLFECQDLGPQMLKGLSTPLSVYRVVGESAAQSRFEVAVTTGLTPLVGREQEVGLLLERWARTKQGEGQVVLLSGEPGIGKSRLVQELKERVAAEGAARIEFRCSPYYQNSALYPVIEHLQRLLQFARGDSPQVKLEKLAQVLAHYHFPQADTLPLLATLLSLPHPGGYPALTLSPQKQREKTQEALVAWLVEDAERAAVYLAWEDLHWADPSSVELIGLLIDQTPTTRILTLLTYRPEFTPPWVSRAYLTPLTLPRLPRTQGASMVEKITSGKALPPEVVQQIVAKTDGVPLFVEELTKMVLESGLYVGARGQWKGQAEGAPLPPLGIPSTLHDALMARLDRLGPTKEIAQLGATLGREFSYELLHAVSPLDEAALQQGLRQLVEAELLYQRSLPPQAHYLFKHALIQDTAYQALLKSTRQQFHRQIAQVLAERFSETVEAQPELVAHHYTGAGLIEQAIPYWQKAGEQATQRSAYVEAISHLTTGLEVLKALPDTPKRVQQELTLQLALNGALILVKGFTAPEVEKTVLRARELCQQLGETPQLFPVLFRLYGFYQNRGELQTTRELAEQMIQLAQSVQDLYFLSTAHAALGGTLYWLGELTSARTHLEQAIALYDPQQHPRHTAGLADPRVQDLYYASVTLWHLGYPDQALKRNHEAVAVAAGLSLPFRLAQALGFAAAFHSFRREWQIARERAEAVMTLSTEQGFPFWLAQGTIVRGGALAEQGQMEEGIVQMQQGLAAFRAMGAELVRTAHLPWLAAAYAKAGQVEEGLRVVAEALAAVDQTGERFSEAELYRLKGQLTLQKFQVPSSKFQVTNPQHPAPSTQAEAEAEAYFFKAIETARKQQARSLELRAVMSLSRLWQKQGKQDEARQMLAEIYGWFTEGFDTKDLQEAKALLQELA